jgi:hypothetical protein
MHFGCAHWTNTWHFLRCHLDASALRAMASFDVGEGIQCEGNLKRYMSFPGVTLHVGVGKSTTD